MPSVSLTTDQVVDLVKQLSPTERRSVLMVLATAAQTRRAERTAHAERRLRDLAAERSLSWDDLDEDARELFVDNLLHEGR